MQGLNPPPCCFQHHALTSWDNLRVLGLVGITMWKCYKHANLQETKTLSFSPPAGEKSISEIVLFFTDKSNFCGFSSYCGQLPQLSMFALSAKSNTWQLCWVHHETRLLSTVSFPICCNLERDTQISGAAPLAHVSHSIMTTCTSF